MKITQRFGKANTAPPLFALYAKYGLIGHNGTDLVTSDGWIYCPVDAKVVYLAPDYSDGYGAYVKVCAQIRGGQYYLYFCHLDSWSDELKAGTVQRGQLIGMMGGSSLGDRYYFGPHLHFGMKPVNPDTQNGYKGYVDPQTIVDIALIGV